MFERNKIYNVDSYQAIKDIPDKSIDLIYTDIPYKFEDGGCGKSEMSKRIKNNMNSLKENKLYDGIDYDLLNEFVRIQPNIYIYIWCSKLQILDLMNFFIKEHNCRFNILVWCKTNPTPSTNNVWLPDIEYCLVFKGNGAPKYNDGYENKSKWYISGINKKDKDLYNHPTIKPLDLVERHLKHSCKKGMLVFDPFLGSGTTAVACKNLGLDYLGFEINKEFYDIASDRLNGISQKEKKEMENKITLF